MSGFTQRPLQLLDGIYRFVGGLVGVNRVDLASDITLVHDVGRQAEKSGAGGYFGRFQWRETDTVNGGPTETEITRVANILPLLPYDLESQYELWLLRASATTSIADWTDLTRVNLYHGVEAASNRYVTQINPGSQATYDLIVSWVQADFQSIANIAGTAKAGAGWGGAPVRIFPNGYVGVSITTTASAVVDWTMDFWVGPMGATPPGLA